MKKSISLFLGLSVVFAGSAFADATNSVATVSTNSVSVTAEADSVTKLNDALKTLLDAFNNQTTSASVTVSKAQINAQRAVELAGNIHYSKNYSEAKKASLDFGGSYSYPESTNSVPTTALSGQVQIDLVALVGQNELKSFADDIGKEVESMRSDAKRQYGNAAQINSSIKSSTDASGFQSLSAVLAFDIQPDQLSAEKAADVFFTHADIKIDLKTSGATFDVTVISNPKYRAFARDGQGLKEWIESLLNQKKEEMDNIKTIIAFLDAAVTQQLSRSPNTNSIH